MTEREYMEQAKFLVTNIVETNNSFFGKGQVGVMLVALLGGCYCVLQMVLPATIVPCITSGCKVVQDFSIGGVSLWLIGAGYFIVMFAIAIRKHWKFLWAISLFALTVDCLLLLVMFVFGSCLPCLGAAVFIAALYGIAALGYCGSKSSCKFLLPLIAWGGLFLAAVVSVGVEQLGVWQISGEPRAERKVYFSPSCPACLDAIGIFSGRAAFIPIAERKGDYEMLLAVQVTMSKGWGFEEALLHVMQAPPETPIKQTFWESVLTRGMLLRNKAELSRMGVDRLPLIVINGSPQVVNKHSGAEYPGVDPLILDLATFDLLSSCGDVEEGLCK